MPIRSFRDLEVYQEALTLVADVYALSKQLPRAEQQSLADQMRRASVSVVANIAEGYSKKRSLRAFQAHLDIALGSCNEVAALLDVCRKVGCLEQEQWGQLTEACTCLARRISALCKRWQ